MAAPIIPVLMRLLFSTGSRSTQSLITKIWNKSGKTISQKRLWELTRSNSGIKQLEQIYNNVQNSPTITKVKKQLSKLNVKSISDEEAKDKDINSLEIRGYLASKVLKRLANAGIHHKKVKPFLLKLASNILSGSYSVEGFSLDEIVSYIDKGNLTDMIGTFKVEALYYG